MDTSIIASLMTGGLALVGVIITNASSNRKVEHQLEMNQAITDTKLENLKAEVEKHNNVIERTYKVEQQVKDIEKRVDGIESHVNSIKGAWE